MINGPGLVQNDVFTAWDQFVRSGSPGGLDVRPEILESWQRCYEGGVNPYDGTSHNLLGDAELKKLLEDKKNLLAVARPLMNKLYQFVKGSGYLVMLTDEHSYILEALGDPEVIHEGSPINFIPGARWAEEDVGTNAIGTCAVEKKPMQVTGSEHYCQLHHPWTCSGAPIMDEAGEVIGILDMSGPTNISHTHTLGMVVAAVQSIMSQMKILRKNRELTITNNSLTSIFTSISEGVLIIDRKGRIRNINPIAQTILKTSLQDVQGTEIQEFLHFESPVFDKLVKEGQDFYDIEIRADRKQRKVHFLGSGRPIRDDQGNVRGGVVLLKPIEKVQSLVNRFSGAQAGFYFQDVIGDSSCIRRTIGDAMKAAGTESSVLLEGESGTGKEILAQAIHNSSVRRDGPFIAVNCGAIPRELIASELFGYVEGAFTGARRGGRPGKFELAEGGTLFLDEIGDMPLEQQVTLLRVLQEKQISRIGDTQYIDIDVRIVCATNKNLLNEVRRGTFRQDLYYRLNVISINIPPLRERREDIPLLFRYFLRQYSKNPIEYILHPDLVQYLIEYDWPGNVRELQNVVERMVNLSDSPNLTIEHLPAEIKHEDSRLDSADTDGFESLSELRSYNKQSARDRERDEIIRTLNQCGGNITEAARIMGVNRSTIYRKIKAYAIDV